MDAKQSSKLTKTSTLMPRLPPWSVCYSTAVQVGGGGGGGGRGWGGGGRVGGGRGVIACGSVEFYGIYSVFYTCGLLLRVGLPCGPLLECVYLHGFCVSRSEQYGIYGVFACFQKTFFSGRSNPVVCTALSTPVHCSCALCLLMFLRIKSRKAGHLSSASIFQCPVSACYFDSVGWDASPKTS